MHVLWFVAGAAVLGVTLADAVGTLVTTRNRSGRFWPTVWFYHHSWSAWRQLGLRMRDDDRRERALTAYGPVSLLVLLMIWVALEIVGWSFVWYGMRDSFNAIHSHLDALYFSGVNFFTVGFGDIVAVHGGARVLVMFAAFTGVTTMALVVGYLPTLYGAYSERERQLLLLDDLSGTETTAVGLIEAYRSGQDLSRLAALFDEWERWAADVMETHTSYRMLLLFRSRRTGQSWLTALAVLAETSATVLACLPDAPLRAALRYYRRSTELLGGLTRSTHVQVKQSLVAPYELDDFRQSYDHLAGLGFELRPFDEAWPAMQALRDGYVGPLATLFHMLLPPRRFLNPDVRYPDLLERLRRQIERGERSERGEEGG
jgi:hypothetical protein